MRAEIDSKDGEKRVNSGVQDSQMDTSGKEPEIKDHCAYEKPLQELLWSLEQWLNE